jgi:hypothetical protein
MSKAKGAELAKQWVLQAATTINADAEAAGIVMLLEIVLALGFVAPVVPVVVCVALSASRESLSILLGAPSSQAAA